MVSHVADVVKNITWAHSLLLETLNEDAVEKRDERTDGLEGRLGSLDVSHMLAILNVAAELIYTPLKVNRSWKARVGG
jgi:hypothetical protein